MIDTLRFEINCGVDCVNTITNKATLYLGYDKNTKTEKYRLYKAFVNLGSYEYGIQIFIRNDDSIIIEFSAPKYEHDHNILLMSAKDLDKCLVRLHSDLQDTFSVLLPPYTHWHLHRIDFCYAWKYFDNSVVQKIIDFFKSKTYSRKDTIAHDTSVMWKGSDQSMKFYAKNDEFLQHDFKRISKASLEKAVYLDSLSRGVLRFECTLRHNAVLQEFGIDTMSYIMHFLSDDYIIDYMNKKILKLLHVRTRRMSTEKGYEILYSNFKSHLASKLFDYWRKLFSDDSFDINSIRSLPRTTRWRYNRLIKLHKLGIPEWVSDSSDILIPSEMSVPTFSPSNTRGTFQNETV